MDKMRKEMKQKENEASKQIIMGEPEKEKFKKMA